MAWALDRLDVVMVSHLLGAMTAELSPIIALIVVNGFAPKIMKGEALACSFHGSIPNRGKTIATVLLPPSIVCDPDG